MIRISRDKVKGFEAPGLGIWIVGLRVPHGFVGLGCWASGSPMWRARMQDARIQDACLGAHARGARHTGLRV
jgi:hypothetical protein